MPITKQISVLLAVSLLFAFGGAVLAQTESTTSSTGSAAVQNATSAATETSAEAADVSLDENVNANDLDVSKPNLLPDSPFYFLKKWKRGVQSFFTFNPIAKANLKLRFASEKLLEARKLAEEGKTNIFEKATENYEKEMDNIKSEVDKIKGKAEQNPKIGKFLDKFTKQQVLHDKILEKLEQNKNIAPWVLENITKARKRHLERFGEVMQKLENNAKIPERLEKNLNALKGSKFKGFKNLEILKRLENSPLATTTKEAIKKARERIFINFKKKIEKMSTSTQERFKNYIEKIKGDPDKKMELIQDISSSFKNNPAIRTRLKNVRGKIMERMVSASRKLKEKTGLKCPQFVKPASNFCPKGRIILRKDKNGCFLKPKCILPAETENSQIRSKNSLSGKVCVALWNPVCGENGKTYSNACWAKVAGVKIARKGICSISPSPNFTNTGKLLWWYDSKHLYCQQKKFIGGYMYMGLHTFKTKAACEINLRAQKLR